MKPLERSGIQVIARAAAVLRSLLREPELSEFHDQGPVIGIDQRLGYAEVAAGGAQAAQLGDHQDVANVVELHPPVLPTPTALASSEAGVSASSRAMRFMIRRIIRPALSLAKLYSRNDLVSRSIT